MLSSEKKLFLFVGLLLIVLEVEAATYYVDARNGNDSNNGLSEITAWRSLAKINKTKFSAGDIILLKRGEIWREILEVNSSGQSGNPIIFDAYGVGSKPIISGADVITGWTPSGQSNVWKKTLKPEPGGVFFDNVQGKKEDSFGGLDQAYEWYWEAGSLFVYSLLNPEFEYFNIGVEVSVREFCVLSSANSHIIFRNLEVTKSRYHGFRTNQDIENVTLEEIYAHHNGVDNFGFGIEVQGGIGIVVRNCEAHNNGWNGIALTSWASSNDKGNWLIEGCVSHHNGHHGVDINTGSANIDISNVTIRYCTVFNNVNGIYIESEKRERISDVKIHYNLAYTNDRIGIFIQSFSEKPPYPSEIQIFNNVMYDNGHEKGTFGMGLLTLMTGGMIKNNIIFENAVSRSFEREIKVLAGGGSRNEFDYNIVYNSWAKNIIGWEDETITYSEFLNRGYNVNGINANPELTDPASYLFLPTLNSPAIDSGVWLGLDRDFVGNRVSQATGVDIGAFEGSGVLDVTPPTPPNNLRIISR